MSSQLLLRRRASCISDKRPKYLKFTSQEDGSTIALSKVGSPTDYPTEYALNKGAFFDYTYGTAINLDNGDFVEFRRKKGYEGTSFSTNRSNYYQFSTSGSIIQSGYITSMLNCNIDVTSINDFAFINCIVNANGFVGSLKLPNTVTQIGLSFTACSGFAGSLIIPDSVTGINNIWSTHGGAFEGCSGITRLKLSNSLTTIPGRCFKDCTGITGEVVIPDSVTTLGGKCFYGCSNMTKLTLHDNITTIGESAFYNCSSLLGELSLPNSLTIIGQSSFQYCTSLSGSIVIKDSVTAIDDSAFDRCTGLNGSITLGNNVISIGRFAFRDCPFVGTLTIPNSVTAIGWNNAWGYVFKGEGFIGTLTIGTSIKNLGTHSFGTLNNIDNVKILASTPPTLSDLMFPINKPIYVPYSEDHSILDAYKTANNWSSYANNIFELDENGNIPT